MFAEAIVRHKTCTTDIFWENKVQNRPATVPPFCINGGSAAQGGEANPFVYCDGDEYGDDAGEKKEAAGGGYDDQENIDSQSTNSQGTNPADDPEYDPNNDEDIDDLLKDHPQSANQNEHKGAKAKLPKPLNIGGAKAKVKRSGPRGGSAVAMDKMMNTFMEMRDKDVEREDRLLAQALEEKKADRNHQLEMMKLLVGGGGGA